MDEKDKVIETLRKTIKEKNQQISILAGALDRIRKVVEERETELQGCMRKIMAPDNTLHRCYVELSKSGVVFNDPIIPMSPEDLAKYQKAADKWFAELYPPTTKRRDPGIHKDSIEE